MSKDYMALTRETWDEFFSTDSINRQAAIRKMVEDRVDELVLERTADRRLECWYYPDAEEGEVGSFEDSLDHEENVEVVIMCRPKLEYNNLVTIPISEILGE